MPPKIKKPDKHPDPPGDLNSRKLPFFSSAGPWFRLYHRSKRPLEFNKDPLFRFNAPAGEYGILYLCNDIQGAFIETYGWMTGHPLVTETQFEERKIVRITSSLPLRFVDLTKQGLALIGADARLCNNEDYELSQKWALSLWNHPSQPDGILYRARNDQVKKGIALFDRENAIPSLTALEMGALMDHRNQSELIKILNRYKFALIPN